MKSKKFKIIFSLQLRKIYILLMRKDPILKQVGRKNIRKAKFLRIQTKILSPVRLDQMKSLEMKKVKKKQQEKVEVTRIKHSSLNCKKNMLSHNINFKFKIIGSFNFKLNFFLIPDQVAV